MTIAEREAETYRKAWAIQEYGIESPGAVFVSAFVEMAAPDVSDHILDAGCGAGAGIEALAQLGYARTSGADLIDVRAGAAADGAFWEGPLWHLRCTPHDWVYCCDVLEHVPDEFTMLVGARLLAAARRGAFFSIALEPDNFGALVGETLHKTVRPFVWWRDRLAELGRVVECRDLLSTGLYLVEPRR